MKGKRNFIIPLLMILAMVMGLSFLVGCSDDDGSGGSNARRLTCTELTSLKLTDVTIVSATEVEATDTNPAHCKCEGVIEADIKFEVLLPLPEDWNEKFLMGGGGGMSGIIQNQVQEPQYMRGVTALQRGYVTAGTDTGHEGTPTDGSAFLNNERAKIDYSYRAVHLTAVTSKLITEAHYGRLPQYSYFQGCSTGGRQGIKSAQQFPGDFDGIVAAAPAQVFTWFNIGWTWIQQAMFPNADDLSEATVPNSKLEMLENAILNECDDIDGLVDGLIRDPRKCDPIPVVEALACEGGLDADNCFTSVQIEAIKRVYEGPSNSEGQIFWGFPPSGEAQPGGWPLWVAGGADFLPFINLQYAIGETILRYWVFSDPEYDFRDFKFTPDEVSKCLEVGEKYLAVDPDLSQFKSGGGKMIFWTGWADYAINPLYTIWWYEQVLDTMGGREKTEGFFRLFLAPNVNHCSGGTGPGYVDWISALEDWVEHGNPPDRIIGYNADDKNFSRPLCPHPEVAEYDGSGDIYDAENFDCMEL